MNSSLKLDNKRHGMKEVTSTMKSTVLKRKRHATVSGRVCFFFFVSGWAEPDNPGWKSQLYCFPLDWSWWTLIPPSGSLREVFEQGDGSQEAWHRRVYSIAFWYNCRDYYNDYVEVTEGYVSIIKCFCCKDLLVCFIFRLSTSLASFMF